MKIAKRETIKIIKRKERFRSMQRRAPDQFVCAETRKFQRDELQFGEHRDRRFVYNHILHTMFGGEVHRIATKSCCS